MRIEFADLLLLLSQRAPPPLSPSEIRELELAPLLLRTVCLALEEWPTELFWLLVCLYTLTSLEF